MDYTSSYASEGSISTNSAITVVAPVDNANGVEVTNMLISSTGPACAFVAKGSTPSNIADGDVLLYALPNSGVQKGPVEKIVVPAGKGVYFIGNYTGSPFRSALLRVL